MDAEGGADAIAAMVRLLFVGNYGKMLIVFRFNFGKSDFSGDFIFVKNQNGDVEKNHEKSKMVVDKEYYKMNVWQKNSDREQRTPPNSRIIPSHPTSTNIYLIRFLFDWIPVDETLHHKLISIRYIKQKNLFQTLMKI